MKHLVLAFSVLSLSIIGCGEENGAQLNSAVDANQDEHGYPYTCCDTFTDFDVIGYEDCMAQGNNDEFCTNEHTYVYEECVGSSVACENIPTVNPQP